jgi:hypothetical protein
MRGLPCGDDQRVTVRREESGLRRFHYHSIFFHDHNPAYFRTLIKISVANSSERSPANQQNSTSKPETPPGGLRRRFYFGGKFDSGGRLKRARRRISQNITIKRKAART